METVNHESWKDLSIKDKAAIITAIVSFILGWILIFLGFVVQPTGEIDGSVLTAFGTALLYSGGAFGIVLYVKSSNADVLTTLTGHIEETIEKKLKDKE